MELPFQRCRSLIKIDDFKHYILSVDMSIGDNLPTSIRGIHL